MQNNTIKLPESFINKLINLPETGMGYQIVKVIMRSGKILHGQKVLNSEFLMLEENETIHIKDIEKIELETNSF
jgi:small nuclear ribonucleoprotein (snRNP)-like protein